MHRFVFRELLLVSSESKKTTHTQTPLLQRVISTCRAAEAGGIAHVHDYIHVQVIRCKYVFLCKSEI